MEMDYVNLSIKRIDEAIEKRKSNLNLFEIAV